MADNKRVFVYSRGEDYKVTVTVTHDASMSFCSIKVPDNTPAELTEIFLEEAEAHVLLTLQKDDEKRYVN